MTVFYFVLLFCVTVLAGLCHSVSECNVKPVINCASLHLSVCFPAGGHLLRPVGADQPLHRLCGGGAAGGAQLGVPPPQAAAAHGQHGQGHDVPRQQHHQPGHVRGVQDQHAGLDDPLAGAQQGQCAAASIHAGQRGHGHHDRHEHRPLLPAAQERLLEEQHSGGQEGEGDVETRQTVLQ